MIIDDKKLQVWSGVYGSFAEVDDGSQAVYSSEFYVGRMRDRLADAFAEDPQEAEPGLATLTLEYLLSTAAAMAVRQGAVRVLDIGGGVGLAYLKARQSLPADISVSFKVIDNPAICAAAAPYFEKDPGVRFSGELGPPEPFEIVHFGSSLQYIETPDPVFEHARACGASWILISDFPCGDIPTFVAAQEYYGKKIPIKFWRKAEIEAMANAAGYRLRLYQRYRGGYLKEGQEISMENYDPSRRLTHFKQLLFARDGEG